MFDALERFDALELEDRRKNDRPQYRSTQTEFSSSPLVESGFAKTARSQSYEPG